MGITARLALAFAAVAALAAAANLIVENGVSMVEQQMNPVVVANNIGGHANTIHESIRTSHPAATNELRIAVEYFDQAVREHVDANSNSSASRYREAQLNLDRQIGQFPPQASGDPSPSLTAAITRHQANAKALIKSTNDRRVLVARYAAIFASMDARLRASIDNAWKIFGRVIARQSLLKLSSQLEDIRVSFSARDAIASGSAAGANRIEAAERAFAATLEDSQSALRRSQGTDWHRAMQDDMSSLVAARISLAQAEKKQSAASVSFAAEANTLAARLRDSEASEVQSSEAQELRALPAFPARAEQSVLRDRTGQTMHEPRRAIVAWISAVVLFVLLYLCFATIVSIVTPVRRLLEASRKLASGETVHAIAPGGIHELDTLTVAFNAMAEQLATAQKANRDSNRRLEVQVDQRTRELQELAEKDPLTGLANRRQLFVALNAALDEARLGHARVGVFFLDMDNFKTLNDSMGHAYGDRVLVAIARRLEIAARAFGFAARLGGDEFMIVHEGATTAAEILQWGANIVDAFHKPINVDGRELIVSVSAGASIFPDHEQDAEALLRAADAALFNAKALGRSQLSIFTPDLLVRASARFAIEQNLRRAIQNDEFELFYQPEVRVDSLEPHLVEALLRWRMPDGTYRLPGEFLDVAEESGLIIEINDWVLRTAIEAASHWHRGAWAKARVAINVSSRQFLDHRFVEQLKSLLDQHRLPAECIELELTESVLQTGPATINTLVQLRSLGVAIALDDFGTGYSSLASLEQLPFTRIKLDRSLIARIDSSARSASITRAIIGLCGDLGLEVTAEGVERIEQFALLLGHRKMSLQGFLIAQPVPRDEVLPLLKRVGEHSKQLLLQSGISNPSKVEQDREEFSLLSHQTGRHRFGG